MHFPRVEARYVEQAIRAEGQIARTVETAAARGDEHAQGRAGEAVEAKDLIGIDAGNVQILHPVAIAIRPEQGSPRPGQAAAAFRDEPIQDFQSDAALNSRGIGNGNRRCPTRRTFKSPAIAPGPRATWHRN